MDQPVETWTVRVDADIGNLEDKLSAASGAGRQFSRAMTTAFQGVAFQGKSVGDSLRGLALSLSQITLKAAFKPLEQGLGSVLQNLIGGGLSSGSISSGGMAVPFASGGVISSPIAFPLQGGATGIAGERGAEAIMPLSRGPDGRLGIAADTGNRSIAVTFNVSTPDAQSFKRTETQIAAMMSRALAQGQRNM
jgi:phage-related minor tail protein